LAPLILYIDNTITGNSCFYLFVVVFLLGRFSEWQRKRRKQTQLQMELEHGA